MSAKMGSIGVFCGAKTGGRKEYVEAARQLAESLVSEKLKLVYGGAKIGIMGVLADEVLKLGGEVIGVIPQFLLDTEVAHPHLTQLHIVSSMHERKILITKMSDGFLMLPGGAGSLDEFFEIFTLAQLKIHEKPFGILNVNHYYDLLISFIEHMVKEGFLARPESNMIIIEHLAHQLMQRLLKSKPQKNITIPESDLKLI